MCRLVEPRYPAALGGRSPIWAKTVAAKHIVDATVGRVGDQRSPLQFEIPRSLQRHLADSLRRLQTDHIDLYQIHHYDRHVTGEEFWGALENFVTRGDVSYIGTSNIPGWGLAKFQLLAQQRDFLGLVSEQTQYNLLNRAPELEVLPAAEDMGIGVMAYMPVAGGLLTGKRSADEGTRSAQAEVEYSQDLESNQQFESFSNLCRELGETETVVAIAWTLSRPAVNSAIVGIRKVEHLDCLERASELQLDRTTLDEFDKIFDIKKGWALLQKFIRGRRNMWMAEFFPALATRFKRLLPALYERLKKQIESFSIC